MKPKMIKQIEDNLRLRITRGIVDRVLDTLIFVMYNKWGWGDTRISRLVQQVNDVYDAIESGHVSLEDIRQANLEIPRTIFKDDV